MVVSSDRTNGAGLWPLFAQFLDERHLTPQLQMAELTIEDCVSVEVDLSVIGCAQEAVVLLWKEPAHSRGRNGRVALDVLAQAATMLFEPPAGSVEGVADGDVEIPGEGSLAGLAIDNDLGPRDREVDADQELVALAAVPVRSLNHHAAADDAVAEPLKPGHLFLDEFPGRFRAIQAVKRDLYWGLHDSPSFLGPAQGDWERGDLDIWMQIDGGSAGS
jgi:hypothetical protein